MSKEFNNDEKDIFRDAFQQYKESGEKARLDEKYRQKTFWEENSTRKKMVHILTFILAAGSVMTGFYYFYKYASILIPYIVPSIIASVTVLGFWEYFKREALTRFFFQMIGRGWFSKSTFAALLILTIGSVFFSYTGGADAISDLTYQPQLTDIDSLDNKYESEIAALMDQRASHNNEKGETYYNSLGVAGTLDKQIADLRITKINAVKEAQLQNDIKTNVFATASGIKAIHFGIAAGLCDLALILSFAFLEYSDKRVRGEMERAGNIGTEEDSVAATERNGQASTEGNEALPGTAQNGNARELRTEQNASKTFRMNASKPKSSVPGTEATCKECDTPFLKKRSNHEFCQEACRTAYWKNRNGREAFQKKRKS